MRRPNNYDPNVGVMLGPVDPDPSMDLRSLEMVKTVVKDTPHKLFVGGLPSDWNEDQVSFSCPRIAISERNRSRVHSPFLFVNEDNAKFWN